MKKLTDAQIEQTALNNVALQLLGEAKDYAEHDKERSLIEERINDIKVGACIVSKSTVDSIARLVEQDRINKDQLMKEENCAYSFYRNVLRCFIRLLPSIGCLSNTDYLIHKEKHKLKRQMNGK